MAPLISVLIPCYQQSQFLTECLNSVMAQTLSNWEAIIVAQDADSVQVASALRGDRVTVLKTPALGVAAARNAAAQASSGVYLFPLDADDLLAPKCLNTLSYSIEGKEHAIAYGNMVLFGNSLGEWSPEYSPEAIKARNCLPNSSLHTRALWEDSGGWEEALIQYEDWAYWVSCARLKPAVTHVREDLVWHRKWGGNSGCTALPWHNVHSAMVRTLYPLVYPPKREDLVTIANEGAGLLPRLQEKLKRYPKHVILQEWVALIEGRVLESMRYE